MENKRIAKFFLSTVRECDACAFTKTNYIQKEHHRNKYTMLYLNKAAVWQLFWKLFSQVYLHAGKVKMLKIFEVSDVKKQQNCDYFTIRHLTWTILVLSIVFGQFLEFFISDWKFLGKSSTMQKISVISSIVNTLIFLYLFVWITTVKTQKYSVFATFLLFLIQNWGYMRFLVKMEHLSQLHTLLLPFAFKFFFRAV
jgi:hypothetical protein